MVRANDHPQETELQHHVLSGRLNFGDHTKIAKDCPYHQDTRKIATLSIAFLQYRVFVIEKNVSMVYALRFPIERKENTKMR
jgi:hypothetical protein